MSVQSSWRLLGFGLLSLVLLIITWLLYALYRQRKQILGEHLLYKRAFHSSRDAIVITDAQNHIQAVNPAFTQITGYSAEEVTQQNPRILSSGRHNRAFYEAMFAALGAHDIWQGELWNRRKNGEIYPEFQTIQTLRDAQGHITHFMAIFRDITEWKRIYERMNHLSIVDALTGLPTRQALMTALEDLVARGSRQQEQLAVLHLDIDRFKLVNESLGHVAGDTVLEQAAQRLKNAIRTSDLVCRHAGDEFIVVAPNIREPRDATVVAEKLLQCFQPAFSVEGHTLHLGLRIGISLFPSDGHQAHVLLQNAESALGYAKQHQLEHYQLYDRSMNARVLERLALERDLRRAFEQGELLLYYQPQVSTEDRALVGGEALMRWKHATLGMVPPGVFIPLAEECGLARDLGMYAIRIAIAQLAQWKAQGLTLVPISVNLQALDFRKVHLPDQIVAILKEVQVEPTYLELELTEGTLMHDAEATITTLRALRAAGIRLSLDDFGTGYSSLSYLRKFPLSKLKIDQSFVRELVDNGDSAAICRSIVALGRSLKLKVNAEGVETEAQLALLTELGCHEVQGYLFSPAVPGERFAEMLRVGHTHVSTPDLPSG